MDGRDAARAPRARPRAASRRGTSSAGTPRCRSRNVPRVGLEQDAVAGGLAGRRVRGRVEPERVRVLRPERGGRVAGRRVELRPRRQLAAEPPAEPADPAARARLGLATSASASSTVAQLSSRTCVCTSAQVGKWTCASENPGTTVRPPRSTVSGEASAVSWTPTPPAIRPPAIASARCVGSEGSSVRTRPFTRITARNVEAPRAGHVSGHPGRTGRVWTKRCEIGALSRRACTPRRVGSAVEGGGSAPPGRGFGARRPSSPRAPPDRRRGPGWFNSPRARAPRLRRRRRPPDAHARSGDRDGVRSALRGGRRHALATTVGNSVGVLFWGVASAVGVSALVAASEAAFVGLKVVGAIVLVWMGIQSLRRRPRAVPRAGRAVRGARLPRRARDLPREREGSRSSSWRSSRSSCRAATRCSRPRSRCRLLIVALDLVWYSTLALAVTRVRSAFVASRWPRPARARHRRRARSASALRLAARVALTPRPSWRGVARSADAPSNGRSASSCGRSRASGSRRGRPRSTGRPSSRGTWSSSTARTASSGSSSTRSTAASARARSSRCVAVEEVSKACATSGLILAVQELGSLPFKLHGTDEQKARFLPRLASGEWLAAYALTEAGSGSDSAALRTEARRDGDEYVLDGSKRFITNAGVAHLYVVFARTGDGHLRVRGRGGHARIRGRPARAQARDPRLDDRRARPRRLPRAGGEPDRRGGRGLPDRDARARPLAAGHRRAGPRPRPGRDRLRARVRDGARDVRRADREPPARRRHARRHGDELRGGARPPLSLRPARSTTAPTARS